MTVTSAIAAQCRFRLDRAAFLRQYETVFLRPIRDGYDGVPVGNGDLAAVHWQPGHLTWMLNKSDISGKASQAARLVFETPVPLATRAGRLETRLSLADAVATVTYTGGKVLAGAWRGDYAPPPTPGPADAGSVAVVSLVPEGHNALLVDYRETTEVAHPLHIVLERWLQPAWGDLARAEIRPQAILLVFQPREDTACRTFAVALRFSGFAGGKLQRDGDLRLALDVPAATELHGRVAVAVVTDYEAADPAAAALKLAETVLATDTATWQARQREFWLEKFWGRFFVDAGHPYATALYLMALYELGITSRGRKPVKFNGGLNLTGERDRAWDEAYTIHNQHSTHLPVYAVNHPTLADNFLDWIISSLPEAQNTARKYFGLEGAHYPEAMSQEYTVPEPRTRWDGDPREWYYLCYILSSGTRLASLLWDRYQYTLDKAFLRRAYPVLCAVATFYVSYGKRGADGRYHLQPSQSWEETPVGRDAHADCAAWRAIFTMVIEAAEILGVDAERVSVWRERLEQAPLYPVTDGVFCVALRQDGTPEPPQHFQWQLPNLASVFPFGIIGLNSPVDSRRTAQATFERYRYNADAGHEYLPVVAARLGYVEGWRSALFNFIQFFQVFDQGLFNYYSSVGNKCEEYAANRAQLHPYLEGSGIFATAVNEMLLQSHDGVIRVFAAAPAHWECRFILLARGAFLVASEHRAGSGVPYVLVQAMGGPARRCCVALPWPAGADICAGGQDVPHEQVGSTLVFTARPDTVYALVPAGRHLTDVPMLDVGFSEAWSPSRLGMTWYGNKEGANNHTGNFPLW